MPDILGYRLKVGTLVPAANSSVEPELAAMSIAGVTHMAARIHVPDRALRTETDARTMLETGAAGLAPALERLMVCRPDRVLVAMAAPCFLGGLAGSTALRNRLERQAGVPVTLAPDAVRTALTALGSRRIGVLTPELPAVDRLIEAWLVECGFEVAAITGLRAASPSAVIDLTPEQLAAGLARVDAADVDALVHVGTSIAMARLVADFETRFAKPVVSVNVACWWAVLRAAGIDDRVPGYGRLLASH